MSDSDYFARDPSIGQVLDQLVPTLASDPTGWDRILAEAGESTRSSRWSKLRRGRRRGRLLVVALAVLAATAIALPAVGVGQGWFLDEHSPQPAGPVTSVTTGAHDGVGWRLLAYTSKDEGLCIVVDALDGQQGAENCSAGVMGEPGIPTSDEQSPSDKWINFLDTGLADPRERLVAGAVASGVARVTVRFASGDEVSARMFPAPSELNLNIRFYALGYSKLAQLLAVIAYAGDGTVLQELRPLAPPSP